MEKNIKLENELKAIQLQSEDCCQMWNHGCPNVKNGAMKMAEWKDNQPISELGGWHTEPPTESGYYLVEVKPSERAVAQHGAIKPLYYVVGSEDESFIVHVFREACRWKRIC